MAPNIGKLICNNKDALQQRDDDTATMMDIVMRKRNGTISESDKIIETSITESSSSSNNQDEILEIAETIRELAVKLQRRRESLNATESNPQLNASLTRTLDQIQKSIDSVPKKEKKTTDPRVQKNLLDAHRRLKSSQDDDWLIDIVTPKAGNLSASEAKTPLHSNLSHNQNRIGKKGTVSGNGLYPNPYPLTTKRPTPKVNRGQQQQPPHKMINDSLATLRNELTRAKTMEFHNENHNVGKKRHPFSTKNLRSSSRLRNEIPTSFERVAKQNNEGNDSSTSNKSLEQQLRSISTGRATQQGMQIINRIWRRENHDYSVDDKTLTATSSDSTHEATIPSSSRRGKEDLFLADAKLDIVVNRHYNSSKKDQSSLNGGAQTRDRSVNSRTTIRAMTPRHTKSTTEIFAKRPPISIDASMSTDISMTSGYLTSTTAAQCPIKYRSIRNTTEKGIELYMPDGITPIVNAKKSRSRSGTSGSSSSSDIQSRTSSSFDRAALSQRLQHHQRSIKEKMRNNLNVMTDHRDDDNTDDSGINSKLLTVNTASTNTTTSSTATMSRNNDIDSTRAIIMRDAIIMNDVRTKSSSSSISSSNYSSNISGSHNSHPSVAARKGTPSRPRRSIIRE